MPDMNKKIRQNNQPEKTPARLRAGVDLEIA
jgi:hypothetical protein